MCGIAGFTWPDDRLIQRMTDTIVHRGPDQCGQFVDGRVSLGHRRLSIIDLSDRGRQPMCNEAGDVHVVCNGEIYNFEQVRHDLAAKGHRFRSRCDTEVLVHAWEEYGPECVERLTGMFAFAIWDARQQRLFLARDRLGIKPLYYATLEGPEPGLIFASEIKALLQCDRVRRDVRPQSVYEYLGYEFVPAPHTIFEHVMKLPPGCAMEWRPGQTPSVQRYWRLRFQTVDRTRAEHERCLRESLERAVRSHLMSDVPLGVFLSGGLDSSALVAMMHRAGVDPLDTFALYYEDASFSELPFARDVATHFNTRHHEMLIDPVSPEVIDRTVWHLDEPMTDLSTIPLYLLCEKVRRHVTVCLSGEGGDETLVGYDRFKASKINRLFQLIPGPVRRQVIGRMVASLPDREQKKGAVNLLKRFVEGSLLDPAGRHMRWQYFFPPQMERGIFAPDFAAQVTFDPFGPIRRHLDGIGYDDPISEEIDIDTGFMMANSILHKVDKMSMAHALEVRVPFLDHHFVEFCATVPSDLKLQRMTTKAVFRTAMRGILPDRILWRGKQGYSLPIKNWLRRELRDYMLETFRQSPLIDRAFDRKQIDRLVAEHDSMRKNHNHLLWGLINLAAWHRLFVEQAPSPGSASAPPAPAAAALAAGRSQ